jgi:hypothetical protein
MNCNTIKDIMHRHETDFIIIRFLINRIKKTAENKVMHKYKLKFKFY